MKTNWIKILLVVVLLSLGSIAFLKGDKSGTEMPNEDEPVVKVAEAEQPATAQEQEIQKRNERQIRSLRNSGIAITKDMVDMNKPIGNVSFGKGQTKTFIRIRYKDGSFSEYTVDNK